MNHEIAASTDLVWRRTLFTLGKSPTWIRFTGWTSQDFMVMAEGLGGQWDVLLTSIPVEPDRQYTVGDEDYLGRISSPWGRSPNATGTEVNAIKVPLSAAPAELWITVIPKTPGVTVGILVMRADTP